MTITLYLGEHTGVEPQSDKFRYKNLHQHSDWDIKEILRSSIYNKSKNGGNSSFLNSVLQSYKYGLPLLITPDNIWISILTQFVLYKGSLIQNWGNFETFTEYPLRDINYTSFDDIVNNVLAKNNPYEWAIPYFTTSTQKHKIATKIILLSDSIGASFSKIESLDSACGLYHLIIDGVKQDWLEVYDKTVQLLDIDRSDKTIQIWGQMLLPIVQKFIDLYKPEQDIRWWRQMCSHMTYCDGRTEINGWINIFNMLGHLESYIDVSYHENVLLPELRHIRWSSSKLVDSYLSAPFIINDGNADEHETRLFAGHMSYNIQPLYHVEENNCIVPNVDWYIGLVGEKVNKNLHC